MRADLDDVADDFHDHRMIFLFILRVDDFLVEFAKEF